MSDMMDARLMFCPITSL